MNLSRRINRVSYRAVYIRLPDARLLDLFVESGFYFGKHRERFECHTAYFRRTLFPNRTRCRSRLAFDWAVSRTTQMMGDIYCRMEKAE